jgi:peptidoglycan LD-endopeptidase LytH
MIRFMAMKSVIAAFGVALVFATGIATAAALADSYQPTATEPTTPSTASTSTSTTTSTVTEPTPPTETATTTATETISTVEPPKSRSAPSSATLPHGLDDGTRVTPVMPGNEVRTVPRRRKKHRRVSKPLKVTPPLGQSEYVFPVAGASDYIDTYGAARSDVSGKWHHGDDIFAPLGAPVVAVASGTINRVGWERVGGWRLWVRDGSANEFYYAHLSGYAPSDFHSRFVEAGQVIGFVGNTGDAFGGASHLHFEVHPRQLLALGYAGAVNPTTYLDSWPHLGSVRAPLPMHPRLPPQPLLQRQAREVFRKLLAARDVIETPVTHDERPSLGFPEGANRRSTEPELTDEVAAPAAAASAGGASFAPSIALVVGLASIALVVGLASLALLGTATLMRRRARTDSL